MKIFIENQNPLYSNREERKEAVQYFRNLKMTKNISEEENDMLNCLEDNS